MHTIYGSLASIRRGYQNHPVVKLYNADHMLCLVSYHLDTIAEMSRRGWSGHNTLTPIDTMSTAMHRATLATCGSWLEHAKTIPLTGPHSIATDMHDLIARWDKEGKGLRNNIAARYVSAHRNMHYDSDNDTSCVQAATRLIYGYHRRIDAHVQNVDPYKVKGNSTLRGVPEYIGEA